MTLLFQLIFMDTSPLGLYYRYVLSEEMRRWPYKANDKVWICHAEVKI